MDPFDTCCVSGISASAQMMLQFAITHQWPAYATSCEATVVDRWKGTTVKIAIDSPCLLQAIIYAGSCYRSFLGPTDSSIDQVRTQSYHETLTLLRKEIQALKGPPPEELLLAIVILAINGTPDYSNRQALTTEEHYRDNEFYFRKPWAPEHFQALTSLTMSKGGLQSISIGPIAAMIFICDLIESFSTLRKPNFSAFPPPKSILCHIHVCPFYDQSTSGFHFLRTKRHGRILLRLVRSARDLLYTYELCLQGLGAGVELWHLVYARRLLQHQALSLETSTDQLYTLCRLAVTVYLIESFVLQPAILPFHDYSSRKLMLVIDECDRLGYWHTNPDLMLWTTILGGLTSRDRPLRWWFAEQLRGSAVPTTKPSWAEVLNISERFLPLKGEQGEGCRLFWEEACDWLSDANQRSGRVNFNMELRVKERPPRESASD